MPYRLLRHSHTKIIPSIIYQGLGVAVCVLHECLTCISHSHTCTGGSTLSAKGLYRLHQFSKVELFGVTSQESGRERVWSPWRICWVCRKRYSQAWDSITGTCICIVQECVAIAINYWHPGPLYYCIVDIYILDLGRKWKGSAHAPGLVICVLLLSDITSHALLKAFLDHQKQPKVMSCLWWSLHTLPIYRLLQYWNFPIQVKL